jgi:serine/threonine-protein kinase
MMCHARLTDHTRIQQDITRMASDTVLNGRYRLVAQQGAGGMAVIYKAVDLSLGRTVAVKVLRPSLTNDRAFLDRFREEARAVANLSHPNIVTVHDFGNEGPAYYIIMEFIEGQNLKEIIKTFGALPITRVLNLAIQICGGIGFAHRAGLVHADIKPQNILVTKEDVVKITDFGIAQAFTETQTQQKMDVVWGSPQYFAPEQARGEKPTPSADVYAIGIVLFEMLTGRLPYMGANQQELALAHIRDRVPLVNEFNPNVPENLARIVEKVMSKDPNQRYRMADQLGHILTSYRDRGRQDTMANPSVNPVPLVNPNPSAPTQPPLVAPTTQPRQSVVPPPPPQSTFGNMPPALPTQRYSVAPEAPQTPQYGRPGQPPAAGQPSNNTFGQPPYPQQGAYPTQGQPAYPQYNNAPAQPASGQLFNTPMPPPTQQGDSGFSRPQYRSQPAPSVLDGVTIALAVLAFISVACLIPLYIAVFNALG